MPRLTFTHAEWLAIAHELEAPHGVAAPPGLLERVRALLHQASAEWTDQSYALELDAGSADAVRAARAALAGPDPVAGQRAASVAEAEAIVRDHQRRS
jgi:uncharacterized protein YgfB (UPF0149 family)